MPRKSVHSQETKNKISQTMKLRRQQKDWWKGREHKQETKAQQSRKAFDLWQDEKFSRSQAIAQSIRPTKPELEFLEFLNINFPDEWLYTGDGRLKINKVNPDYVNNQGKNLIIELFGEYFHKGEDINKRKAIFSQVGFECLIVWSKELLKPEKLALKIRRFLDGSFR